MKTVHLSYTLRVQFVQKRSCTNTVVVYRRYWLVRLTHSNVPVYVSTTVISVSKMSIYLVVVVHMTTCFVVRGGSRKNGKKPSTVIREVLYALVSVTHRISVQYSGVFKSLSWF